MAKKIRKSITATKELRTLKEKIDSDLERMKEISSLAEKAREEELLIVDQTREKIDKLCEENGLKCELRLTWPDVLSILEMFVKNKETIVTIGYGLYYSDNEDNINN